MRPAIRNGSVISGSSVILVVAGALHARGEPGRVRLSCSIGDHDARVEYACALITFVMYCSAICGWYRICYADQRVEGGKL